MTPAPLLVAVLRTVVPAAAAVVVAVAIVLIVAWAVRRSRRSPRARRAADDLLTRAGAAFVRLDDARRTLDTECTVTGVLTRSTGSVSVRRARITAGHTCDEGFAAYRALRDDPQTSPQEMTRAAGMLLARAEEGLRAVARARAENDGWALTHRPADALTAAARTRLADARAQTGDLAALRDGLSADIDEGEWADVADVPARAADAFADAEGFIDRTAHAEASRSLLADLALAQRRVDRALADARRLDEVTRLVAAARDDLPPSLDAADDALADSRRAAAFIDPEPAAALRRRMTEIEASLATLRRRAVRAPRTTAEALALLHRQVADAARQAGADVDAAQHARVALPVTMIAARSALVGVPDADTGGIDARTWRAQADAAYAEALGARTAAEAQRAAGECRRLAECAGHTG